MLSIFKPALVAAQDVSPVSGTGARTLSIRAKPPTDVPTVFGAEPEGDTLLQSAPFQARRDVDFEFKLTYKLPSEPDIEQVIDKLGAAGCTDALVGLGVDGQVALEFVREASTAEDALQSALEDVKRALPGAKLVEARPDLVAVLNRT